MTAAIAYLYASVVTNITFYSKYASTGALMAKFLSAWNARLAAFDQLSWFKLKMSRS